MNLTNYEVSVWEYRYNNNIFDEYKIVVIGGSNIDSKSKIIEPNLTQNINGKNSFNFGLYTRYFSEEDNKTIDNPFIGLLQNGSKIKLKLDNEWYEFIITNIEISSDNKKINYQTEDAFAYELGKSGYELEFEDELSNNQDTAQNLASKILENTSWTVDNDSDIINQYKTEPLIEFQASTTLQFTEILNGTIITLQSGEYFYGFFSQFYGNDNTNKQFIFTKDHQKISNNGSVILDKFDYPTYFLTTVGVVLGIGIVQTFQASRLVENQEDTHYDSIIGKFLTKYTKGSVDYDVYTTTNYIEPTLVRNWIDMSGFDGRLVNNIPAAIVEKKYYPEINSQSFGSNREAYYKWNIGTSATNKVYYNLNSDKKLFGAFEKPNGLYNYILGLDIRTLSSGSYSSSNIIPSIVNFRNTSGGIVVDTLFNSNYITTIGTKIYYGLTLVNNGQKTISEVLDLDALKLSIEYNRDINVFSAEFYPYYYINSYPNFITPNTTITNVEIETIYNVIDPNQTYTSLSDIKLVESLNDINFPLRGYTLKPRTNIYEKIRSINGSKSNRYNLLQTICEQFECWMEFNVSHNEIGKITNKKIKFLKRQGKILSYGFINGINLSSANRNTISSNLVSKMIVAPNANQYAENGSCNIALSKYNPIKESTLFNFDYYLMKNMLDKEAYLYDFYRSQDGWFNKLYTLNTQRDPLIEQLNRWQNIYDNYNADYEVQNALVVSSDDEKNNAYKRITNYSSYNYEYIVSHYNDIKWDNKLKELIYSYEEVKKVYDDAIINRAAALNNKNNAESKINTITETLTNITVQKQDIMQNIYNKYYPFIQEGTWIDENYMDNDLYYLDAENTLYISAFPQVSYSLKVIDISSLEDFTSYVFKPGDITYVENTEFFGWKEDNITPEKIRIYISEIKRNLDDPTSNSITVQNYESDFDSLFQKITATTQTLEYKGGVYNRASNIVTSNSTIEYESIADALNTNKVALDNIGSQTVQINDSGITTTDGTKPNYKVRMVGSGVYLSNDGGENYKAAITGNGINADYINAGTIDAGRINIMDENNPSFRWDKSGLNAYSYTTQAGVRNYDITKAVRIDRLGLYSFHSDTEFIPNSSEELWNDTTHNVTFQLTEKGMKLNQIHSDNNTDVGRIELGYTGNSQDPHGYQVIGAGTMSGGTTPFKVYEDGHFSATSGEFTGSINSGSSINAGTNITIGGSQNGQLIIKDSSNNQIGSWTSNGIDINKGQLGIESQIIGPYLKKYYPLSKTNNYYDLAIILLYYIYNPSVYLHELRDLVQDQSLTYDDVIKYWDFNHDSLITDEDVAVCIDALTLIESSNLYNSITHIKFYNEISINASSGIMISSLIDLINNGIIVLTISTSNKSSLSAYELRIGNKPLNRYIAYYGYDGEWQYSIWNDNIAEIWGTFSFTPNRWVAWGNIYETDTYLDRQAWPLIFAETPFVTANCYGAGGTMLETYYLPTTTQSPAYWATRGASGVVFPITVNIYARGRITE